MSNNYHSTNVLFLTLSLSKNNLIVLICLRNILKLQSIFFLVFEFADGFVDDKNQEITEKTISCCAKLD